MTTAIRDLTHEDQNQVNDLCSTTWGGNDYVPEAFPNWIDDPNVIVRGRFDGADIVSICALEIQEPQERAFISGLRTREGRRREGHGKELVSGLIDTAAKLNIEEILYITSSDNQASIGLATQLGFSLVDEFHFFNLFSPFPPHQKPNDFFKPQSVTPEHLVDVLERYPLVPSQHLPYDYGFHRTTIESLRHISKTTDFRLVTDEQGRPGGFYYRNPPVERGGERRVTYHVFATDRAVFIDLMARIIDEIVEIGAARATFLMGQKAAEWAPYLGYTDLELGEWPGEYSNRRLQLYSRNL